MNDYSKCPGVMQTSERVGDTDSYVRVEHVCPLRDQCRRYTADWARVWMLPYAMGEDCEERLPL